MAAPVAHPLLLERIWADKWRADDAERNYMMRRPGKSVVSLKGVASPGKSQSAPNKSDQSSLVVEIEKTKQHIRSTLEHHTSPRQEEAGLQKTVSHLVEENRALHRLVDSLEKEVSCLKDRMIVLEKSRGGDSVGGEQVKQNDTGEEDEIDLFGESDEEEDEEVERLKQERIKQYEAKKSKKPATVAKSSVVLDVKPWDDETDMKEVERSVRSIQMDGLVWGKSQLVPVGYGIKKLQITSVIVDDLVSVEELDEKICAFEDCVQSVDVAAFNKI